MDILHNTFVMLVLVCRMRKRIDYAYLMTAVVNF